MHGLLGAISIQLHRLGEREYYNLNAPSSVGVYVSTTASGAAHHLIFNRLQKMSDPIKQINCR